MTLQEALAVITKELVAGERTNDEKQFAEAVGTAVAQVFTDLHSIAESLQVIALKMPGLPDATFTFSPISVSADGVVTQEVMTKFGGDK